MKNFLHFVLIALAIQIFSGCASAPSKVPHLTAKDLPTIKFNSVEPRTLALVVENSRKANIDAGNASAVEAALTRSLTDVLREANIKVDGTSHNKMRVFIVDRDDNADQGECLNVSAQIIVKGGRADAKSSACHALSHFIGFRLGGDVEESYRNAMRAVLTELDKQLARVSQRI
jgi:hypothetical protein